LSLSNEGQEDEIVDAARIFHRLVSNPDVDIVLLSRMPKNEQFFQESLSLVRFLMCTRSSNFASKVVKSDPDDMCQAASNMLDAWSTLGEQALNFDQKTDQFLSPGERQRVDSAISRIFELFVTSRLRLASLFAQMEHSDDEEEEDIHGPELGVTEVKKTSIQGREGEREGRRNLGKRLVRWNSLQRWGGICVLCNRANFFCNAQTLWS